MKKRYIEPQAEVITVEVSNVICTSPLSVGGQTQGNVTSADSREFEWDDF